MKRESKLTNAPHGGITSSWLLALLLIGVTLGANPAQAQPFAYVANGFSDTVSVIDTATNTVSGAAISVGSVPFGIAITPDGSRAYVTNLGSDTVSVITTSNMALATVTLPLPPDFFCNCPYGIAITPDGSRAYVANQSSASVSVITTSNNMVAATVNLPVGSFPFGIAITPDGSRAYVANGSLDTVSVIDTTALVDTNPATVDTIADISVGSVPFGVAITPDGSRAYVTNILSDNVSIIDTNPASLNFNTVIDLPVPLTAGSFPRGVAITPDGSRAYVANNGLNTVSVIDTTTKGVQDITVGSGPYWVAITPDGSRAYVTNNDSDNVSVIDTNPASLNFNTVIGLPLPVGSGPVGLAITPLSSIVPFSALTAKVEIERREFEVQATFTLGPGSNGIDPPNEAVSLKLTSSEFETFSITIPALSFNQDKKQDKKGSFKFKGVIDDVALEVVIARLGNGRFLFKAEGKGADLTSTRPRTRNQVEVELIIGDDGGSPTATAYSRF